MDWCATAELVGESDEIGALVHYAANIIGALLLHVKHICHFISEETVTILMLA